MPHQPDPKSFQTSITEELLILRNRVRFLIGDAHWGEDGSYKEAILRKILRGFLPKDLNIGTGFIVENEDFPLCRKFKAKLTCGIATGKLSA